MRISEFKRLLRQKYLQSGPIRLMVSLDELYVYPSAKNKLINLVCDGRSVEVDGRWHIQPIAISDSAVYIVCPYCHEIHLHGNADGVFEGVRVPHCADAALPDNYKIIRPRKEDVE